MRLVKLEMQLPSTGNSNKFVKNGQQLPLHSDEIISKKEVIFTWLVDKENAEPLVMGKRVMKGWVIIKYKDTGEYKKAFDLFKEAMAFVSLKT